MATWTITGSGGNKSESFQNGDGVGLQVGDSSQEPSGFIGSPLTKATFSISYTNGKPSGNMVCYHWASNGDTKATSDSINMTELTSSYEDYEFTFSTPAELAANDVIGVEMPYASTGSWDYNFQGSNSAGSAMVTFTISAGTPSFSGVITNKCPLRSFTYGSTDSTVTIPPPVAMVSI